MRQVIALLMISRTTSEKVMGVIEKSIISATTLRLIFAPGGVASGAILEVRNSLLTMFSFYVCWIMLVAGIAVIRAQAVGMANLAGIKPTFTMIEGECMQLVI